MSRFFDALRCWTTSRSTCACASVGLQLLVIMAACFRISNAFFQLAHNNDFLPTPILDDNGQKANLSEWKTEVYLLFCHGAAAIYFRTPPVMSRVHLIDLNVRLKTLTTNAGNYYLPGIDFRLPASPLSVDNATGLARVDMYHDKFACTHNCLGYVAEIRAMTFNDTYSCVKCHTSTTEPGCIYYPNGTVISTKRQGVACMSQQAVRELRVKHFPSKCQQPSPGLRVMIVAVIVAGLGFLLLFVAVSCGIALVPPIVKHKLGDGMASDKMRLDCIRDEIWLHITLAHAGLLKSECDTDNQIETLNLFS